MTPEYFYNQLNKPINWKLVGHNHTYDENTEEMTVFGKVYDDWHNKKFIRVCFAIGSERCFIVERNQQKKYKTVIDCRAIETERLNEFIAKTYL